jgi:hypothetical protein
MTFTRRTFVLAGGLVASVPLLVPLRRWLERDAADVAPLFRPRAAGGSGTRCARCGASGHGALDRRCPATAAARVAVQADARRRSAVPRRIHS